MNSQREEELKPCPFCGTTDLYLYPDGDMEGHSVMGDHKDGCMFSMTGMLGHDTEQSAIDSWNTRQAATEQGAGEAKGMTNAQLHGCEFPGWQCFHCGEVFTTVGGARDHFGTTPEYVPGCMVRVQLGEERGMLMRVRELEAQLQAHGETLPEAQEYRNTLERGIAVICEAIGTDTERYDRDQSDISCYMDCFNDVAKWLKEAGVYYDHDEWEVRFQFQVDPIYIEVAEERARQDVKWGGSAHDDQKAPFDWIRSIRNYAGWAEEMAGMDNPVKYRRRIMQVATLAVAAAQSHDRLIAQGQKEESSPEIPVNEESLVRHPQEGDQ